MSKATILLQLSPNQIPLCAGKGFPAANGAFCSFGGARLLCHHLPQNCIPVSHICPKIWAHGMLEQQNPDMASQSTVLEQNTQ